MKFSYHWLKELVGFTQSPDEISDILTQIGHEIEGIESTGLLLEGITTVEINSITPHPNADKLVITQVYNGSETIQIVTGAANISEGDIVPMSPPDARLSDGSVIKQSKLRGEDSFGMLCSEVELGVADEANGIWILPPNTPVGIDFISHARLQDTIYDISILPNRGDCQSHIGIARDLSAYFGTPLILPPTVSDSDKMPSSLLTLTKELNAAVPNYTARKLQGISHKPTPLWMQQRLRICDIRPIGLVVDITNYVLLETGQPLHAFDKKMIHDETISIRYATPQEKFCTLDGDTLSLNTNDIVICTKNQPIALGGIMGGSNSEVTDQTTDIILESAQFNPISIRKSARRLVKRTESAIRFEKGVDPIGVISASDRAAYLYHVLSDATIYQIEQTRLSKASKKTISYSPSAINTLLGTTYTDLVINTTLTALGFQCEEGNITVPTWRENDIHATPCLSEEMARIQGFDTIEETIPQYNGGLQDTVTPLVHLQTTLKPILIHLGLSEVNTYPMISADDAAYFSESNQTLPTIQNPLSRDQSIMRPLILPSLLKIVSANSHRQNIHLKLFEIGKGFGEQPSNETLYLEGIMTGQWNPNNIHDAEQCQFHHSKGIISQLSTVLKCPFQFKSNTNTSYLHPVESLDISLSETKETIGKLGIINPKIAKHYGISASLSYFQISLTDIAPYCFSTPLFKPFSKYPSIRRDIALLAPQSLSYSDIESVLTQFKPKGVSRFYLFDLFESESIGSDKKSMAFAFIYHDLNKTLSDARVNRTHDRFIALIQEKLPVTIRA